jgi:hypothetical protein
VSTTLFLDSTITHAFKASLKEALVQDFLEETETVRRILQAQTAALLLTQTSFSADLDHVLATLRVVDGWIAEISDATRKSSADNAVSQELAVLIPSFRHVQEELLGVISVRKSRAGSLERAKGVFERLRTLNARAEKLLEGTSAEVRTLKNGCACENDRFAMKERK